LSVSSDLNDEIEADSVRRRSLRGGAATFGAQGAKFAIRFTAQIVIARLLVPADYGLIAMVAPVLGLLQLVGDLGLGQAVVQRQSVSQREVSGLFWIGLAVNVAIAVGVAGFSPLLAWIYQEPRLLAVSIALAAVIPITGLSTLPLALLRRNLRFGALALLDILPPAVGLVVGFSAAWLGLGYWSLILGAAAESLSTVCVVGSLSRWRPSLPAISKSTWSLVVSGGHFTLFNLATYATMTLDNVFIAITLGAVPLGLYDRAYKIVTQPFAYLTAPFDRIAVPVLVRLLPDPERYNHAYLNMLQLVFMLVAPGLMFGVFMAEPLMSFLLGAKWAGIAPIVSWLCFGALASPLYSSAFWLFLSQERTDKMLRYGLLTALVSVVGFAAGLPWGAAGVAAGAGLSFFVVAAPVTSWGATRAGPVSVVDLASALVPIAAGATATLTALAAFSRLAPVAGLGLLTLAVATAYATFFVSFACLPAGRRVLRSAWELRSKLRAEPRSPSAPGGEREGGSRTGGIDPLAPVPTRV
jgi:PST family polysaccharide transporter